MRKVMHSDQCSSRKLGEVLLGTIVVILLVLFSGYLWAHYVSATYNLGFEETYWTLAFMGAGILVYSLTLHGSSGLKDLLGWLFGSIITVCLLAILGTGIAGLFFLGPEWALPIVVVGAVLLNLMDQQGLLFEIPRLYEKHAWLWPSTAALFVIWLSIVSYLRD